MFLSDRYRSGEAAYLAMLSGLSGAAVWSAIPGTEAFTGLGFWLELRVIAVSAGAAGFVCAPFFGRGLPAGMIGAVMSTLIGSVLAAVFLGLAVLGWPDGLIGIVLGPAVVSGAILADPLVGGLWLLTMGLTIADTQRVRPGSSGFP